MFTKYLPEMFCELSTMSMTFVSGLAPVMQANIEDGDVVS